MHPASFSVASSAAQSGNREGVPIVFGVTGHRDIPEEDIPVLQAAVRDYLQKKVLDKYPYTPVVFLSALAEGADRIAAQAAIDAGCRLGVFLPFAEDDYLRDFDSETSKTEFHELLAHAEFVEVAPRLAGSDPEDRIQGYVAVGIAIARHAQCLMALWDGIPSDKQGGTADVVNLYRTGVLSLRAMPDDLISNPECGPLVHFFTRRSSNPDAVPASKIGTQQFLPPMPAGLGSDTLSSSAPEQQRWDKIFACIERFNMDAAKLPPSDGVNPYTRQQLVSSRELANQWPLEDEKAIRIANLYATADALSTQSQQERLGDFKWIIRLAVLAVFFEQLYSGPLALPLLLAISIVWALLATWQFKQVNAKRLEEKYLDCRTLAEAARVQFFWHLSGLPDCPADHYLRDQRDELEWLRLAIRATDLPVKTPKPSVERKMGIQIAQDAWVKKQLDYFRDKAPKQEGLAKRNSRLAGGVFYTAIGTVLFTVAFHTITNFWLPHLHESVIPTLTVVYGLFFAVSGIIKLYGGIMAYQEQANRYGKMAIYFDMCNNRLEQALAKDDLTAAQQLLLAMGRQALAENAEWLLLHRQRPVEVPLGG